MPLKQCQKIKGAGAKNVTCNGLFPLPDSDLNSDTDSCTTQDFSIGSDSDSDPLIEMYVIRTEICP